MKVNRRAVVEWLDETRCAVLLYDGDTLVRKVVPSGWGTLGFVVSQWVLEDSVPCDDSCSATQRRQNTGDPSMEHERVLIGDVWEDNDSRIKEGAERRRFEVLEIQGDKAVVKTLNGLARRTKIKLERFRPTATGYRLVSRATKEA